MSYRKSGNSRRFGLIERDILLELSAGDMLVGMLLSGRNTKTMYAVARERAARRQAEQRAYDRLAEQGFVGGNDDRLHLTKKGKMAVERIVAGLRTAIEAGTASWDGHWRLIAFDVPEKYRSARKALRRVLKRARFLQLQQSVWVSPYECAELQFLLAEDERLKGCVVYAKVTHFNEERWLLKYFRLKRKS